MGTWGKKWVKQNSISLGLNKLCKQEEFLNEKYLSQHEIQCKSKNRTLYIFFIIVAKPSIVLTHLLF